MRAWVEELKRGWTAVRVIRLVLGLLVLGSGIGDRNTPFILLGTFFVLLALVAPGTCCNWVPPSAPSGKTDINETDYEEVGGKQ